MHTCKHGRSVVWLGQDTICIKAIFDYPRKKVKEVL
jgi:hypothetical protein